MKNKISLHVFLIAVLASCNPKVNNQATPEKQDAQAKKTSLFLDVHNLEPGKVKFEDVAGAHQKDLATQDKFGVHFLKYWVDETAGKVYCLAEAPDSAAMVNTHKEAHGLLPQHVELVTDGPEASKTKGPLFFDIHYIGAGKVTAADVAGAHEKDLAVQKKYGVNFINYWVDQKAGIVMCLAESPDSAAMVNAHKEAHGLIPDEVHQVKEGN